MLNKIAFLLKVAKIPVGFVVSSGVGAIAGSAIRQQVDQMEKVSWVKDISVIVGAWALQSVVSAKTTEHVLNSIDTVISALDTTSYEGILQDDKQVKNSALFLSLMVTRPEYVWFVYDNEDEKAAYIHISESTKRDKNNMTKEEWTEHIEKVISYVEKVLDNNQYRIRVDEVAKSYLAERL